MTQDLQNQSKNSRELVKEINKLLRERRLYPDGNNFAVLTPRINRPKS